MNRRVVGFALSFILIAGGFAGAAFRANVIGGNKLLMAMPMAKSKTAKISNSAVKFASSLKSLKINCVLNNSATPSGMIVVDGANISKSDWRQDGAFNLMLPPGKYIVYGIKGDKAYFDQALDRVEKMLNKPEAFDRGSLGDLAGSIGWTVKQIEVKDTIQGQVRSVPLFSIILQENTKGLSLAQKQQIVNLSSEIKDKLDLAANNYDAFAPGLVKQDNNGDHYITINIADLDNNSSKLNETWADINTCKNNTAAIKDIFASIDIVVDNDEAKNDKNSYVDYEAGVVKDFNYYLDRIHDLQVMLNDAKSANQIGGTKNFYVSYSAKFSDDWRKYGGYMPEFISRIKDGY